MWHKKTGVDFFGEMYTMNGHKPAQTKVSAIMSMPEPSYKKQAQSFIGMVNYLSKFSARLAELSEHIRELSKDKVPFNWGPEHQEAFNSIKREITGALILAYYNPKKETILQTDASIMGLGHAYYKKENPYILQVSPSQKLKRGM